MKALIIISVLLIVIGTALFAVAACSVGWDFTKLGAGKYETNTHEISEDFTDISINTNTADIVFIPSNDGVCKVTCYEDAKEKHSVKVTDGTLTIEVNNGKKWYDYIGFYFKTPELTVYLPKTQYNNLVIEASTGDVDMPENFAFADVDISVSTGDVEYEASASGKLKICASTGDIEISELSAGEIELLVSTGKIEASDIVCEGNIGITVSTGKSVLEDVKCKSLSSSGSTGNISLEKVIATEKLSIKRGTGDVIFEDSDAAEIFVETSTGNVKGSLMSEKIFVTKTRTGNIDVPKNVTGGICEITTSTGNIKITTK